MGKRLLLIYPRSFTVSYGDMRWVPHLTRRAGLMNVSLPTLAAMTPRDWEVQIVDENVEPIPFDERWDLVGITGFHTQIHRATEIAARFRLKGVPVVCGGASVSVSPERWRPFTDVLFIGEADRMWPRFLRDFLAGRHEAEYREDERFDPIVSPVPDYSAFSQKTIDSFYGGIVQTSRGCPFSCEFCDVIVYVGRHVRHKSTAQIVEEVAQLHRLGMRFVVLADDNFTANRAKAKEILRALGEWNHRQRAPLLFATQLSIDAGGDDELLRLASEAGLNRVLIGIESPDEGSLREAKKLHNVREDMLASVRRFHEHGIMVLGTSIVGFDNDDTSIFRRHLEFFEKAGILSPQPFPLQAPDGTPLQARLVAEGRYRGWGRDVAPEEANNFNTFTVQPKQMTVEQLRCGTLWLIRELYRPERVQSRLDRFFQHFDDGGLGPSLNIPRQGLERFSLEIVARVLGYTALRASNAERWLLAGLLRRAARSAHPQKFAIALSTFLLTKNVHEMARRLDPHIERIPAPDA